MKLQRIIYRLATGLFTLFMLFSVFMYFSDHAAVPEAFTNMGYPVYIIYPLAVAKMPGLPVIWYPKWKALKEWVYTGFFFDFVLACFAHETIGQSRVTAGTRSSYSSAHFLFFRKKSTFVNG
ncbi:DoxX family protein [Ascidiimonas aurantiaca]|uniref:DoxX family protein n=1 Tax=Ascidiimonas aurantiaca TaxID=1685432 RepID=UPI0030ED05CE